MNMDGYPELRRTVLHLTGIDLDQYKGHQLERRLHGLLRRAGAPSLAEYSRMLLQDPARVQQFRDFLTINVTEFFRNPEKFAELKEAHLRPLLRRYSRLTLWSAGCSTGAEPYSLVMLLHELDPGGRHRVLATDLDATALAVAKAGIYGERELQSVDPRRRQRYFTPLGDGRWQFRSPLREWVVFQQHNLLTDPFPADVDVILCRNVVIYLREEAKLALYRRFHQALKPEGILFVGGTESLLRAREIGFGAVGPFFYRAGRPVADASRTPFPPERAGLGT